MDWSKIIDWIKLSPRYLLPISLVSGAFLFLDQKWTDFFGLTNFINQFRPWISVVFFLSIALIISDIIFQIINWGKQGVNNKKKFRNMTKRLFDLTPEEKDILLGYFLNNTRTQYLSISDGIVKELEAFEIIFRSSNIGNLDSWSYNIQPWAWKYIKSNWNKIFSKADIDSYESIDR
ncbi:MAG: superinfection exclusion B family protein [Calditrichaeota bacterium]|nr:superinfection exclusion B family protein [Calditrichota bacterium]